MRTILSLPLAMQNRGSDRLSTGGLQDCSKTPFNHVCFSDKGGWSCKNQRFHQVVLKVGQPDFDIDSRQSFISLSTLGFEMKGLSLPP